MRNILKYFFTLSITLFINTLFAQDIIIDKSPNCIDAVTQFSISGGSVDPATDDILWELGEGQIAEDVVTAEAIYAIPGVKTVVLKVNGVVVDSRELDIYEVNPELNLDIVIGCEPLEVTFSTSYVVFEGIGVQSAELGVGDGAVILLTNGPNSYVYGAGVNGGNGTYNPTLIITDDNGCVGSVAKNVTVWPKPEAKVASVPTVASSCDKPFDVVFNDDSDTRNNQGMVSWDWDFGEGTTDTGVGPFNITYSDDGSYIVNLQVENSHGCRDTLEVPVSIGTPTADFLLSGVASQDSVCGVATLVNASSTTAVSWKLGNQTNWGYHDWQTINYNFGQNPGTVTISIRAQVENNGQICEAITTREITVPEIIADFEVSPNYGCEFPYDVTFVDKSVNADTYFWAYGTGYIPSDIVGGHDYSYVYDEFSEYSRNANFQFYPQLQVSNKYGCIDLSLRDTVNVFLPNARFMPDTTDGCAPLMVTFSDSVSFHRGVNDVIKYTWHFGDGTPDFVGGPNDSIVQHEYTNPGTYHSYLIIETEMGCVDTSFSIPIHVGEVFELDINTDLYNICGGDSAEIPLPEPLSVFSDVDMWGVSGNVEAVDAFCFNEFNDDVNGYIHFLEVGQFYASLEGLDDGCYVNNIDFIITYNVSGPIARHQGYRIEGCGGPGYQTIEFSPYLGEVDSLFITYFKPEGDVIDTVENPTNGMLFSHYYANPGTYTIQLRGRSSTTGCEDYVDNMTVTVYGPLSAGFDVDPVRCANQEVIFNARDENGTPGANYTGYAWRFDTEEFWREVGTPQHKHVYKEGGEKQVTLRRTDPYGCTFDSTMTIYISDYDAIVGRVDTFTCYPYDEVVLYDSSNHDIPFLKQEWLINNIEIITDTLRYTFPFMPLDSVTTIRYVTLDTVGCLDTAFFQHYFHDVDPAMDVDSIDVELCHGEEFKLLAMTSKYEEYKWVFGEEDSTYGYNTTYALDSGTYATQLIVTDFFGCKDTSHINLDVQVFPVVDIYIDEIDKDSTELCATDFITFRDSTQYYGGAIFGDRIWDLDKTSGQTDDGEVLQFAYNAPGPRQITLTVTSSYGCTSTAERDIVIGGPYGELITDKETICKGETVEFTVVNGANVENISVDYGDGIVEDINFLPGVDNSFSHVFNVHPENGLLYPFIRLNTSIENSLCIFKLSDTIYVHEVIAGFDRGSLDELNQSDTIMCFQPDFTFNFFNTSSGIDDWLFDYGDGSAKDAGQLGEHPDGHIYQNPGVYDAVITVSKDNLACKDTVIKKVHLLPEPVINVEDLLGCSTGDSLQLNADAGEGATYLWSPVDGLSNPTIGNPKVSVFETTTYSVAVTDAAGCYGERDVLVKILRIPYLNEGLDCDIYNDTTLIIGESLVLDLNINDDNYTYSWTPADFLSCDDCYNPSLQPLEDIEYTVHMVDTSPLACFDVELRVCIKVLDKASVDVPTAFSPNGDGVNDILFVDGWGVKDLVSFRIYNRWGDLIFETDDKTQGWDGTYKGVLQEQDVYIYQVVATFYAKEGKDSKQGNVTLFR